jgi:hypothetical protein
MQTVFTVAEVLFTLLVWGAAIYFTIQIFRELRRIKAAYDARMALARARRSVADAQARAERLYMDQPSWSPEPSKEPNT